MEKDIAYFCPVCGNVENEDKYTIFPEFKKKCSFCGKSPMLSTGKSVDEFHTDLEINWRENVRKEFVYDNPLFNEKKSKDREYCKKKRRLENDRREHGPKCPTCGSSHVEKMGAVERGVSIAMLGMFSKKINKTFKCDDCGYTW